MVKSLKELCAETILDNNINYQELHDYAYYIIEDKQHERNLLEHKRNFKDTLYIFNTINYDTQSMIHDYIICKIQPIKSQDFFSYDHIVIIYKYMSNENTLNTIVKQSHRFIQEIEFYKDQV